MHGYITLHLQSITGYEEVTKLQSCLKHSKHRTTGCNINNRTIHSEQLSDSHISPLAVICFSDK